MQPAKGVFMKGNFMIQVCQAARWPQQSIWSDSNFGITHVCNCLRRKVLAIILAVRSTKSGWLVPEACAGFAVSAHFVVRTSGMVWDFHSQLACGRTFWRRRALAWLSRGRSSASTLLNCHDRPKVLV